MPCIDGLYKGVLINSRSLTRSEPPMPMFTTSLMLFPLKPFHSPLRTLCKQEKAECHDLYHTQTHTDTHTHTHTHTQTRGTHTRSVRTWQKAFILSSTRFTSGITSLPSTLIGVLERLRRATWSTARPCTHTHTQSAFVSVGTVFQNQNLLSVYHHLDFQRVVK